MDDEDLKIARHDVAKNAKKIGQRRESLIKAKEKVEVTKFMINMCNDNDYARLVEPAAENIPLAVDEKLPLAREENEVFGQDGEGSVLAGGALDPSGTDV
nr:hypothetical protein [Tanacetum cinerariifolium]